jgi:hypothetical protein
MKNPAKSIAKKRKTAAKRQSFDIFQASCSQDAFFFLCLRYINADSFSCFEAGIRECKIIGN